jgi:hypothetical protein
MIAIDRLVASISRMVGSTASDQQTRSISYQPHRQLRIDPDLPPGESAPLIDLQDAARMVN